MRNFPLDAFEDVPRDAGGHFSLNFYAAVYALLYYMNALDEINEADETSMLDEFSFLAGYFEEMSRYMPDDITWDAALEWWIQQITYWEQATDEHLPLLALTEKMGVGFQSRIALMLVGLNEEDSRFGTLFSRLQEPQAYRRPSLELVEHITASMTSPEDAGARSICSSLLSLNLVEAMNMDAPRAEWALRVPEVLWDVIKGKLESHLDSWCQYHLPESFPVPGDLIIPDAFLTRLEQLPALAQTGKVQSIVIRGTPGSERLQVIGSVARAMQHGVLEISKPSEVSERQWQLIGPLCSMTLCMPIMKYDLEPGETVEMPALNGYSGPVGIIKGLEGGLNGPAVEKSVTLDLPASDAAQRMRYWADEFAGYDVEGLGLIDHRFQLPGGYIREVAKKAIAYAALDGRETIRPDDVREASRTMNHQLLDTLADHIEVDGSWEHLVVSEGTRARLQELELRCRYRENVLKHLGPAFGAKPSRGVRALFTGASGTGKTLAARILATELGMDLYRVDLAAVVNKYIGETEKNLHQVLSRAEELDVILLLDEGDAFLGTRTEVKSANDRYANLETDYLLQRLEHYQGIVLVTTNEAENIDKSFQRRMDVVINFVSPEAKERFQIWGLHLPETHEVDGNYLEDLSVRCELTGGQIRNASFHATLLALEDGDSPVMRRHLEKAVQGEYLKAGAVSPLSEGGRTVEQHGGMVAFLDALSNNY